jgi:hypothetical protein
MIYLLRKWFSIRNGLRLGHLKLQVWALKMWRKHVIGPYPYDDEM